jgi:transcriptional regulator with XRE-family HTH domain
MAKRHTRAEIASILALRDREGLSYAELSRRTGIQKSTLAWWGWRGRREQRKRTAFVEVGEQVADAGSVGVEIEMANGVRLRLARDFDTETLLRALRALRESC